MACRRFSLFTFVITQVEELKATIIKRVTGRLFEIQLKLEPGCPPPEVVQQLLEERDNILNFVKKVQRKVIRFEEFAEKAKTVAQAATITVQGIEAILIASPVYAGTYLLFKIVDQYGPEIKAVLDEVCDFEREAESLKKRVNEAIDRLNAIDLLLAKCVTDLPPSNLKQYASFTPTEVGYKGYRIVTENDPTSPAIAPKRFAVAYNRNNVAVIKGPSSFASDPLVLIEEVKFRIDNQLP